MYIWTFRYNLPVPKVIEWYTDNSSYLFAHRMVEDAQIRGLTFILLNTLLFMYPVLLLLKRWKPPFGTITFLFVLISGLMGVLDGFYQIHGLIISLVAGLSADLLLLWRRSENNALRSSRLVAVFTPIVLWGAILAGWLLQEELVGSRSCG